MPGEKVPRSMSPFATVPLPKISTGIEGLDEVLDGGYPQNRTTIIKGGPGAGKTLVALRLLVDSALRGTPGILLTFEESAEAVRANAATLGWDLPSLEAQGLLFLHHARVDATAVTAGPFSLAGLIAIINGKAAAMNAGLLVIDAIDILMRRFDNASRARDELSALHEWLDEKKLATLISVKLNDDPELAAQYSFLDYMADCVIRLDHRVQEQISTRRLRVLKYRGSGFGSNEYPYVIGNNAISLVPIATAHLEHKPLGDRQSCGNAALDEALCGGYRRNACVLIAGASGTGKTTLACTFVAAACARGERTLYISYEESSEALVAALLSAGIDLGPALASGKLTLTCRMPEAMGSDEHLFADLQVIKAFEPDHVVVDAISACHRMGSGKAAFDYCVRLVNACKQRNITCLLTNQTLASAAGEDLSGIGVTSLVDTVLQLRFDEHRGELRRSLLISKARGSAHSLRPHDLDITDRGLVVRSRRPAGVEEGAR